MEFDRETLLKLGKLARISIKDKQLDFLSRDLSSILKFVDQLKEINTENIDPTANSLNQNLIRREDEKSNTNNIEDVLENAPEKELNFYVVPKVIE
jgi:aspartyl-tRNA(Asn)/glutamyl-tRNA(Gln) amidotransferase subunit C